MTESPLTPVQERRQRYRKLIRIVDLNTGAKQPPTVAEHTVVNIAACAGVEPDDARSALQAAVRNADLLRLGGRYAVSDKIRDDEDAILAVIEYEVASDDTNRDVIAWCNDALQDIRWRHAVDDDPDREAAADRGEVG